MPFNSVVTILPGAGNQLAFCNLPPGPSLLGSAAPIDLSNQHLRPYQNYLLKYDQLNNTKS
jgi:hypothetical protein